jgi:transcriptional regulator with XRE-family HTH domain
MAIYEHRKDAGCKLVQKLLQRPEWTQEKLAKAVGVSRRQVARWSLGEQRPMGENLEKLTALSGPPLGA